MLARLDECERILKRQPFLCGEHATAADICLFATLLRSEAVYHCHFKCNLRPLRSYPNLWELTRAIYQVPRVAETCHLDHIKLHYYRSHESINPTRLVPLGPIIDFEQPVSEARRHAFAV